MLWIWQLYNLNPRQDGLFWGCSLIGWGGRGEVKRPPPYDLSDISYNDKTWHSYTLLKEVPKTIWIRWHIPWVLLISVFNKGNSIKFCYIKKYRYRFSWVFNDSFNRHGFLRMSTKMASPGLLNINFFWKRCYDVIISAHDVTSKTLSVDSNYNVTVVMWPKFSNSSTPVREVTITSVL